MRLLALIETPAVIRRILTHLGMPTEVPAPRPSRAPPLPLGDDEYGISAVDFDPS